MFFSGQRHSQTHSTSHHHGHESQRREVIHQASAGTHLLHPLFAVLLHPLSDVLPQPIPIHITRQGAQRHIIIIVHYGGRRLRVISTTRRVLVLPFIIHIQRVFVFIPVRAVPHLPKDSEISKEFVLWIRPGGRGRGVL